MGDINTIADFINSLGFPIAVCIYLAWSNEKLRQTLESNTHTIESLKQLIINLHSRDEG